MTTTRASILGLDAGQTATKAVLVRRDGSGAVHARGGPVDHFACRGARSRNATVIRNVVADLCRAACIGQDDIVGVAAGWTGVRANTPEVRAVEAILADVLPAARLVVVPDYVIGLAGASGGETGIVVVAGGGAIAYGVDSNGRDAVAGGLGYLLGDEGSAYDIGRRAVAAAGRSSDGRGRQTALESLICETFDIATVRDITRLVYANNFSRDRLAGLAPHVARVAGAGDAVAAEIMETAGDELGRAATAVAKNLALSDPTIYTVGGVFQAGETVLGPFRRAVEMAVPHAHTCPPAYPPVMGALLLARRAVGDHVDATWLSETWAGIVQSAMHMEGSGW